jgi:hypothetical protein
MHRTNAPRTLRHRTPLACAASTPTIIYHAPYPWSHAHRLHTVRPVQLPHSCPMCRAPHPSRKHNLLTNSYFHHQTAAAAAADRAAYVDPALSAVAREEGNRLFKEGDFAGAVKSHNESIKRDPNDARGYNNRALAYTKLVALP